MPNKNTRKFSEVKGGLIEIKIRQLMQCDGIVSVVVSTDDPDVKNIVRRLSDETNKTIQIYRRPAHLATSETSTDDVIAHVPELINKGSVLWTHVTSPFVDHAIYNKAIAAYQDALATGQNDSLLSVTNLNTFIWNENGPVNYKREVEKWPRTQTLPNWYEVNSAIFIASIDIYRKLGDRIGERPLLFPLDFPACIDIDTLDQFKLAESIWKNVHDV